MKTHILTFTSPRAVEIQEASLAPIGPKDVLVETIFSAISPGSEMLVYRGEFPRMVVDACIPGLGGEFRYPLAYGYACVGRVMEIGKGLNRDWLGKLVFAFQPHTSHFVSPITALIPIPLNLLPETAAFLPNMETAVNLVHDVAPLLGERGLVLGQGIVGLLATSLLAEFPLESLVSADNFPLRRAESLKVGAWASLDPCAADFRMQVEQLLSGEKADFALEISGAPAALNDAIALTRFSGRVIVGSWYGEKQAALELGGDFHRSRIQIVSSQVSSIRPELSGRWDKLRRFGVAWKALARIRPEKWVTQRVNIQKAPEIYKMLDEAPHESIQVLFEYAR